MNGKQLRAWRERLELTQFQAAKELGLSLRGYVNYEHDEREIPKPVALATETISRRHGKKVSR